MKLTSAMIKEYAAEIGIDDIGIASIDTFKDAPPLMNPKNYFPEAKSVIVIVQRIPRGTYRGIEEGTHWHNYTFYAYNRLNAFFRPLKTYEMSCFLEDHGAEAVPCYPAVPERNPMREAVKKNGFPSDIVSSVRILGAGAGVGEIGWSKVFINKKFGPRVRLGSILTDIELEADPILEKGTMCIRCGKCVSECPGNAIPEIKKENEVNIKLGEKKINWGDVHMGRCTLTHHGFNNKISPFHKEAFPNMKFDVEHSDLTEEEAYRLCYPTAIANWHSDIYDKKGDTVIDYYKYVMNHTGYFAVCGARGCIRACMDVMEKTNRIENTFKNPFYKKKSWLLPNEPGEKIEGNNPWRNKYLDGIDPKLRKGE